MLKENQFDGQLSLMKLYCTRCLARPFCVDTRSFDSLLYHIKHYQSWSNVTPSFELRSRPAIYLFSLFFFSSLSLFSHGLYQSAMIQSSLFIFIVLILFFSIRADAQSTQPLVNHQILSSNITSSGQQHFYFNPSTTPGFTKRSLLTLTDSDHAPWTKRDPTTTFYLTLTSCSQPSPPPNYQGEIPSIDLYLSTVNSNTLPGPTHHQNNNTVDDTLPGRISWHGNTVPELWIGVAAPTLTAAWTGQWTYELAISTQRKSFYYYPLLPEGKAQ